jgi:hypothetical protein
MPRASVGVGPMRVGSGCCVALVVPILIVGLLVGVFVGLSNAATSSARNARRATFHEINATQADGEGIGREEEGSIKCNKLTSTKYHCNFKYYSPIDVDKGCVAGTRGYSYVTFDRYGTEVNLHISANPCVERSRRS